MKPSPKFLSFASIACLAIFMSACSGVKGGTTTGGGTGTGSGSFTIGGTVSGLTGTGLVLQDNAGDNLTVAAAATKFTFVTSVASGGAYKVTVLTQPSSPAQTCTVTSGTGTASANVTSVTVACTTNAVTATIGGNITGLAVNSSVILQDNGGDSLTLTANGPFTFKTPVTGPTDAYAVTVLTQPTTPNQICSVASASGTASANVTNVAVSCVNSFTIGGSVTGLTGSGLILQDTDGNLIEQLPVSAANGNQPFTFKALVPTGSMYNVTIFGQPTNPGQTCVVATGTGSGTATANVTTVSITCPAVTYSVGGVVVGLAGVPPNNGPETDGKFVVEDTNQDTLNIPQNGPFTFAHPYALNDSYQISVLHTASTQPQYCTLWDYKGVVTMNVTGIVVDCAHDDWTWIDGGKTAGTVAKPIYGTFPTSAPTTIPNPYANTPGARYGSSGWTDKFGNLWLFGGNGWELAGNTAPDTLDLPMNDMWVCIWDGDGCQWQLAGGYDPTTVGTSTVGAAIIANAQFEGQTGVFPGAPLAPEARVGAASWTDTAKNFWLFGGRTPGAHFRNDLWKFDLSAYNGGNYTTAVGQWTQVGGTSSLDQPGVYTGAVGSLVPGARVNAVYWTDANGNFWMFGGYGFDVNGNIGYLNDLWEYTGGNWVWKSSAPTNTVNQNGIYGQPGTPGTPGGRQEAIGWADSNGNLWLFGGEGEDSVGTANGILDDFWVYSIANNQWTFVMGSTAANQTGSYASQTVVGPVSTTGAASTCGLSVGLVSGGNTLCSPVSITGNFPGSRIGASGWIDAGGNLWLFGGWGLDSTATNGNGALNDLWVYTPSSTPTQAGTWAWVKGSNTGSPNGIYGDELRGYKTYYIWTPGGRSNATSWVDNHGQFWLFGGEGYDSTDTNGNGYLNDTWRYLPYQDY